MKVPSQKQIRARINANRETAWRPPVVFNDGTGGRSGGVEKNGMAEIFKACHDEADGLLDVPEDVVILDDADIPGATSVGEVS
jgi:hypothetical protein